MPNKTFYIPERDESVWAAAQRIAKRDRKSLYNVVTDALQDHLPRVADAPAPDERWAQIAPDIAA